MLTLEPAKIADTETIWKLRNDVATRRELGLKVISFAECLDWVANIVERKSKENLLVAKDDKLGIVGFVVILGYDTNCGAIKVSIGSAFRGRGYGRQSIKLSNDYAKQHSIKRLTAEIRGENYKALFAFEDAGYSESRTFTRGPSNTEYFTYEWNA